MFADIFNGIFDENAMSAVSIADFFICVCSSLILGTLIAFAYTYRNRYTRSFLATLALLPAIVCVIIMMVNGNIGTGIAVAGAFSLVRFRSAPGTAAEIGVLFLAMGAGIVAGMGYIAYAFIFAVLLSAVNMLYARFRSDSDKGGKTQKTLRITIPEDLNYDGVFDDVLDKYASSYELTTVKTTNMGSLFRLTYDIELKETGKEKEMIDLLRQRNGNLEISISGRETNVPAEL